MKNLVLIANIALEADPRREELDSIEHLVIPAIAIREGVLNNIFYPAAELADFVEAWNGVPVPVDHPMDGSNYVTANSTIIEQTKNIGRFYNVFFEDGAVKGEIWINIPKAEKLGFIELVNSLESGEQMEISTGLLAYTKEEAGEFNGKKYTNVISTIRPDHLALLPDTLGACSIEDGCGAMRTNCKGGKCSCGGACKKTNKAQKVINSLKKLLGFNVDTSYNQKEDAVRKAIREAYGKDYYPYVLAVYETYAVFELGPTLYRQSYTLDSNMEATLNGERQEVRSVVEYVPVTTTNQNNMDPKNKVLLVAALASAMVTNGKEVTEESKTALANMPDDLLSNMAGQYKLNEDGTPLAESPAPVVKANADTAPTGSAMSAEDRELLDTLKQEKASRLANKRKQVVANFSHVDEATASKLDETALDALLATNSGDANYALGGAVRNQTEKDYTPPSIFLANDNDKKGAA